jgi:hypothetical protein
LVYFGVGGAAVTAEETQPGRATFAETVNRPSPRKRLLPKKKTSSGFEFVSGLADGASAMPAKWSRPVFSFRFYEGKISRPLIVSGDFRDLRLPA